jgi:hypothetical protein
MTDEAEPAVHPLIAFEQQADNRVPVKEDLGLTDPLVLKTQRLLNKAKRDTNGLTIVPAGALHIRTSREQRERALRLMQAQVTAFEARGFPVTATEGGARVTILDEPLGFPSPESCRRRRQPDPRIEPLDEQLRNHRQLRVRVHARTERGGVGRTLIRGTQPRISHNQEGSRSYFVPLCIIGIFSSAILLTMSSAEVSGFTVFSM